MRWKACEYAILPRKTSTNIFRGRLFGTEKRLRFSGEARKSLSDTSNFVHVCCYRSSKIGCSRCTAGAPASSPPCVAPPRQRGSSLPGHGKTPPRRTDTRGPQRASSSRPRLASGLSAEVWRRGLNACFHGGSGTPPMASGMSSSIHSSVDATPDGAAAGDSGRQLSPAPTAAPGDSGSADDAGESRRATAAHNERTGSIIRVREACMVLSCKSFL